MVMRFYVAVAFFPSRSKQQFKFKAKPKLIFRKMATLNICRYNRFGYCRYGEICRKHHIDELCGDSNCDSSNCVKRHPKECKYFRNYRRCKFNPCKFSHNDVASVVDLQKFNIIAEKIDTIEETLKHKIEIDQKVKELDERIKLLDNEIKTMETSLVKDSKAVEKMEAFEDLVKTVETKIGTFQSNLAMMKTVLSEKDVHIQNLENKINDICRVNEEQNLKIEELVNKN